MGVTSRRQTFRPAWNAQPQPVPTDRRFLPRFMGRYDLVTSASGFLEMSVSTTNQKVEVNAGKTPGGYRERHLGGKEL